MSTTSKRPTPRKYPPELRERAVRLVREAREQEPDLSVESVSCRSGRHRAGSPSSWGCIRTRSGTGRRVRRSTQG